MAKRDNVSHQVLRQLLDYDPETGLFLWKPRPVSFFPDTKRVGAAGISATWNTRFANKPAFEMISAGRLVGRIFGKGYAAHRVAWAITYGEWPENEIDHIDGDPFNNRISNLRDVSHTENMANMALQSNSTSGVTGVSWNKRSQKWQAYYKKGGVKFHIGSFVQFADAVAARETINRKFGFSETHGKRLTRYAKR